MADAGESICDSAMVWAAARDRASGPGIWDYRLLRERLAGPERVHNQKALETGCDQLLYYPID